MKMQVTKKMFLCRFWWNTRVLAGKKEKRKNATNLRVFLVFYLPWPLMPIKKVVVIA